jgi:hypothetical protein
MDDGQRPRVVAVGQRLADRHVREARERDDLAWAGLLRLDAVERLRHVQLADLRALHRPVRAAPGDRLAAADDAVPDAADGQAPDVERRVEVGDVGLQRVVGVVPRGGHVLQQQVHERPEVLRERLRLQPGAPRLGVAVDDRELDLALVRVEVEEQVVHLVEHLGDAGVGAVDLVDHEDHGQPCLERLAEHEAGLRQRALGGVHEQQHGVDHGQPALHLAPKSAWPGVSTMLSLTPR